MAKRRSTVKSLADEPGEQRPVRRKRKFLRRLIVLGLLLVVVVCAVPTLIAKSPLRDMLLNWQMPVGGWHVRCDSAGFRWFGGQSLTNVVVTDPKGNPLTTIEEIELQSSLFKLIVMPSDLGNLRIVRPTAYLAMHPEGSNLEEFINGLAAQRRSQTPVTATSAPPKLRIEIVEGTLEAIDEVSGSRAKLEQIQLTANIAQAGSIEADGSASIVGGEGQEPGRIKFRIMPVEGNRQQLDLLTEGLVLDAFSPLLARRIGDCQLSGVAALDAHLSWQPQTDVATISTWGRGELKQFSLTGAALQGDRLRSEKVVMPWKVDVVGDEIDASELKLDCDWAQIDAEGKLGLSTLKTASLNRLPKQDVEAEAKISLAKLAEMLPATLKLRDGVEINSGDLEVRVAGGERAENLAWTTKASLSKLRGQHQGKAIDWQEPVELVANWADTDAGGRLEKVSLKSSFADSNFTTGEGRIEGDFKLNLDRLSEELSQFVDMAGMETRGTAEGKLILVATDADGFTANGQVTLEELVVTQAQKIVWEEPRLDVNLQAAGSATDLSPQSVTEGEVRLRGSRDQLTAKLLEPVDLKKADSLSADLEVTGALEAWAGRLRPWLASVPEELSGEAAIRGRLSASSREVAVSNLEGSLRDLHVRDNNMAIDEPAIQFSGDGSWSRADRKIGSREFQLASSVVALRSRNLQLELAEGQLPVATGDIAFRADLERLSGAVGMTGKANASWPRGSVDGMFHLATSAEQLAADFTLKGEQLQLVRSSQAGPPTVVWSEPQFRTTGKAIYQISVDTAKIENFQVAGQTVQVIGEAICAKLRGQGAVTIKGKVQYDPAALSAVIASYAGPNVNIQGDSLIQFEARGQLTPPESAVHWSRQWQANLESGWSNASVFGLPISAGKITGSLREGRFDTNPLSVAVGDGRLTAQAAALLDPSPQQIVIPAGPLITDVQISPAVSEQMLKYVAPMLAGATRVDGKFSLNLAETHVPLDNPKKTRTAGTLAVHQLNVLPGPMIADLVSIIEQVKSLKNPETLLTASTAPKQTKLLSMNDQQIEFQIVDERVYHRQLQFVVDDVPIRSQGSVGFDQTLAIVIEIPIQDRWIDGEDALRGLAGQSLQIPIQGTFQNPRVDQRAIADITKQILRSTAREAIGGEINRQLEKLFQGK